MFTRWWRTICSERNNRTPAVRSCTAPRSRTRTAHLGYLYTTCTKLGGPVGPCTTGVPLPDRPRMFNRPWQAICSERHFRTLAVRILRLLKSDPNNSIRLCVCTKYTKLGGPIVSCTPGVRLPECSQMFTRPWQTLCSKRHFRTAAVRICTAPRSGTRTAQLACVCTNYKKLEGPVVPCTSAVRHPDRSQMFNRPWQTHCSKKHFRTPPVRICTASRIWTPTARLSYLYTTCTKLGGPVGPCTTGVRLPDRSRMFTRPWQPICSERHFRTPPVRICTAPRSRTRTAQLGCVCTNYKKLVGPVVPCTPGVRLPDRSRMFTRPWQTICSERHFCTPPVRICTAPRSRTRTAQLGSVCVESTPNLEGP